MLDSDTKKRIDDLRGILVGKIPSPESQVEQITTGLIYKFMNDMDSEAVDIGGVASFFVGDFEKYSWKNLFDPKLGGAEKVVLYSDAIEAMYTNPNAPTLFREIFKNSFLPFKDPSTLNMFLKGINEFHYSHSEKLGDAFEYLLSFMGSQGDAGQFRTPRHIIDFIVEIVNPQKHETILDPACGTAGFLISSYKRILSQNTDKKLGDKLNASDRKQVGDNLVGYDISPDMTRISLVNMYLHHFANPQIHEYDTLSSEDRWNEYYDVILANPPFFSPTGGIQPHSRFGVQSTRAEVLFIDYIMEHLKPNGRAGIIVPEGIISRSGNTYKQLRKKLIDDCLIGVISLPKGIFEPYSGVKTSVLLLDKETSRNTDDVFLVNIENDGFSLNTNRNPINQNELPRVCSQIKAKKFDDAGFIRLNKNQIVDNSYILSFGHYSVTQSNRSLFPYAYLGDLFDEIKNGKNVKQQDERARFRVSRIQSIADGSFNKYKTKWTNDEVAEKAFLKPNDILFSHINSIIHIGKTALFNDEERIIHGVNLLRLRTTNPSIIPEYALAIFKTNEFLEVVKAKANQAVNQASINTEALKSIKIPLPPIEVQNKFLVELKKQRRLMEEKEMEIQKIQNKIEEQSNIFWGE
jgi:type I restriction enzyme M protein